MACFSLLVACPEGTYRDSTMVECKQCGNVGEQPNPAQNKCGEFSLKTVTFHFTDYLNQYSINQNIIEH